MKVFVFDLEAEGTGLDLAVRAQDAGHAVKLWCGNTNFGKGLVPRVEEWEPQMDWADLIVLTGNSRYENRLAEYFGRGYPIFGSNIKSSELELDRGKGQEILKKYGIETIPYKVVSTPEEAIALIEKTGEAYAMKPWGGEGDKAMTSVPSTPEDAIYTLECWKRQGLFKGQLMMQEKVDGVEIGISGMFGPAGWNEALEESFEHKKFLTGDLGENTGEMGTVIRHVRKSKLFEMVLEPITDYLHVCQYVGDCSVNCIIDKGGQPWPLEFTMRLGWPDFCIRQELLSGDPVEWMLDLLEGQDSMRMSTDVAVGVLMAHGDFPRQDDPAALHAGAPLRGVDDATYPHLHYQQVMAGSGPVMKGGKAVDVKMEVTAGQYVVVATGAGRTVKSAQKAAYAVVEAVKWPSNVMYRIDIGDRLKDDLPKIQKHGFATGMKYE